MIRLQAHTSTLPPVASVTISILSGSVVSSSAPDFLIYLVPHYKNLLNLWSTVVLLVLYTICVNSTFHHGKIGLFEGLLYSFALAFFLIEIPRFIFYFDTP